MSKSLLKSTAIVSGMTLISRGLGFLRDMLYAQLFGASAGTDAFFVAFRIPNMFRRLFGEGAFSQAFVPVLGASKAEHGETATRSLIDDVATVLTWALIVTCVIGVLAALGLAHIAQNPAILVALNILKEGLELVWRSTQGLMDEAAEPEVQATIEATLQGFVQGQPPGALRFDHVSTRRAGQRHGLYLLLGSASMDLLRQSGESLAGRIAHLELAPLTLAEASVAQAALRRATDRFDGSAQAARETARQAAPRHSPAGSAD